jgi:hypothetical protein
MNSWPFPINFNTNQRTTESQALIENPIDADIKMMEELFKSIKQSRNKPLEEALF